MTNGDISLEAALRILEAQFDELDKAVGDLSENDVVRLIKVVDHLDLIIRLASFRHELERQGVWRKHAIPPIEDPPISAYIGPDGVRYAVYTPDTRNMLRQVLEDANMRRADAAVRWVQGSGFFDDLFPLDQPSELERSDLVDKLERYGYPNPAIDQMPTRVFDDFSNDAHADMVGMLVFDEQDGNGHTYEKGTGL